MSRTFRASSLALPLAACIFSVQTASAESASSLVAVGGGVTAEKRLSDTSEYPVHKGSVNAAVNGHAHIAGTSAAADDKFALGGHYSADLTAYGLPTGLTEKGFPLPKGRIGADLNAIFNLHGAWRLFGGPCGPGGTGGLELKSGGSNASRRYGQGYLALALGGGIVCMNKDFVATAEALVMPAIPHSSTALRATFLSGPFEVIGQLRWEYDNAVKGAAYRERSAQVRGSIGPKLYVGADIRQEQQLQATTGKNGDSNPASNIVSGGLIVGGAFGGR